MVDTAEGDHLISAILETTVNRSLTAPVFSTGWIINGNHDGFGGNVPEPVDIPRPDLGRLYHIGYNEGGVRGPAAAVPHAAAHPGGRGTGCQPHPGAGRHGLPPLQSEPRVNRHLRDGARSRPSGLIGDRP